MFKLPHSCTHLTYCKVMLKILQATLQQYVNWELPDIQAEYRKSRGTSEQIANIHWIVEKAKEFQKSIYLLHWLCESPWLCGSHKLWEILKEMGIADHLTCLLRSLYTGQDATVRTGYETTGWFQIGKAIHQGCILSPCLFNLHDAEHIMQNTRLDEPQSGIKISGKISTTSDMQMTPPSC